MSMTGLEVFDSTIHKTHAWLNAIMTELGWDDRHRAYLALRASLQALRDRLTVEEAIHLGAQLPMLIRGFYYEGWHLAGKPLKRHKREFLSRIEDSFESEHAPDPEQVARAVFKVLAEHISAGEVGGVKSILPHDLRELWPPDHQS
ncbi:MAG: DUF2267 domain-containing protein [Candidatus Binatia bacterium]